jgi:hypothetical protein
MRYKFATALAGVFIAATTASAFARPAVTTTAANIRSGPGVQNPVVGVIPAGAPIDVGTCASWCLVRTAEGSGYVSRSLIAFGGARGPAAAVQAPAYGAGYPDDSADNDQGYGYGYGDPGYAGYDDGWGPGAGLGFYGGSYGGGWRGGGHWDHRGMARGVGNPGAGRHFGGGFHGGAGMHPGAMTAPASAAPGAGFRGGGGFHGGGGHDGAGHHGAGHGGGFHGGGFHGAPGLGR